MRLRSPSWPIFFLILLAISAARSHQIADDHRKLLDDSIDQSKCGGCPCGNPCPTTPVYPSPPPPPPPVYTPPPPPSRKTPSTGGGRSYCPPPPSNFIYITGPPGSLYPIDQTNGAAASRSFQAAMWATGVVATLFLFHHQF